MKVSKFLNILGLITGLMSANMIEIPSIKIKNNNAIAITIPNFSPSANFKDSTLTVEIPAALIQAGLSEVLRANEGEIKSTEFQKVRLVNMRATLTNRGVRVSGNWRISVRERITKNPLTGNWSHTPWVNEQGNFHQDFNLSVVNGQLRVSTNGRPNVNSSAWYGVIIDEVIHYLEVRKNVKNLLDEQLSRFNGLNLQEMLVKYGANTAANQLGVDQNQVSSFINSNVGGINGNFNSSRLTISLSIPSLQTSSNQPKMILSNKNTSLAINAWDGAQHGTVLRLHKDCNPSNPDCTWTYKNGMFVSDKDPSLAINAWDGAQHGTVLRLHNKCVPSNPDCTWSLR
ncbi:hypothetical protein [Geminocystis sp.]|uniref:hypothetical protein n=1 Tax=Geminocystis sp. TaxID=2664100 RepID=UPI003594299F